MELLLGREKTSSLLVVSRHLYLELILIPVNCQTSYQTSTVY